MDIDHPDHGTLRQLGIPYGLSATPGRIQGPVPRSGEHTDELRAEADGPRPTVDGRARTRGPKVRGRSTA